MSPFMCAELKNILTAHIDSDINLYISARSTAVNYLMCSRASVLVEKMWIVFVREQSDFQQFWMCTF